MTKYYEIIPQRIVHGTEGTLTYQSREDLDPGMLITAPVGKRDLIPAIVIRESTEPSFKTRETTGIIEPTPLPTSLISLAVWMSEFYVTHPVTTWQSILPRGLLKTRRISKNVTSYPKRKRTTIVLKSDQHAALTQILQQTSGTSLLHGITGSGKTQVYIELAKKAVSEGRSVLVLVPEIALTAQLIAELTPHFEPDSVTVTHSTMTESTRHQTWKRLLNAKTPQVVIGPRSALFSPVPNLGLIVIDECHEPTFKQEKSPRYSTLRAAAKLAEFANARLVLGSATPSISDYYLAERSGRPILTMNTSARKDTVRPDVSVIDMTKQAHFSRHRFFSNEMIASINSALKSGHQSLLFHNRRGTAPTTMCESCGWSAHCPKCYVPLTLHADSFLLRCHICNHTEKVPTSCPECHRTDVIHKGIGTKLLETEAKKIFPAARIARFDGDSETAETLDKQYQALYDGEIDIIIGTQVVAKGLDLPKLRVVGVVQADAGLSLPDYQSAERTFQLISQVSGRVGRNEHPSKVVVQSYQPTHPSVVHGVHQNYQAFYEIAIAERERARFPPFVHLAKLICIYNSERGSIQASQATLRDLQKIATPRTELLGPTPAFYERVNDSYRWQIVAKSPVRADLIKLVKHLPATHWQFEIDPTSLL